MTGFIETITEYFKNAENFIYTYIITAVLLVVSVYFSLRTKFVQIRLFPDSVRSLLERNKGKGTSSFQALMISTAARVGTGCIAGVSTAIVVGGAGAVFWMWIVAIISSSLTFIECTLAQMYKVRDKNGEFRGGPAYYIEQVLKQRWFGVLFSVLLVVCYGYGFNALQAHMISDSMSEYIDGYADSHWPLIVGIILAIVTFVIIFGGMQRIGFVSSYIVPVMSLGYMALGVAIIAMNLGRIPSMIINIFKSAFDFKSIGGGLISAAIMEGVKKGIVSHESGMGSAANIAAAADVSHPAKQGISQIFSVFITTFLVCTTTAFIVLLSGIDLTGGLKDIALVQEAIKSQVGDIGNHFLTLSIFFFAFSSIMGNYSYAESNILFIKDSKKVLYIFRITCVLILVLGAIASSELVWSVIQVMMSFMIFTNIVAMVLIGNRAVLCLKDYVKQKKEGKDPVFKASNIGLNDMSEW